MYTDDEPTRGLYVPGAITADTTLGEIANLVGDRDVPPTSGHLSIETVTADGIDSESAIADAARARRVPYLAFAATFATGGAAWGCAEIAATVGPDAHTGVVIGTWAATALALPVLRLIYRNTIPDTWRRRWWLAGAAAAGWVDVAAMHGPASWDTTAPLVGALVLGAVALSARWADENEVPNPSEAYQVELPAPAPRAAIDSSRAAHLEQAWAERVAGGRRPILIDAWITGRDPLPNATRWLVQTDPGSYTFDEMFAKRPKIAAALGVGLGKVVLERYGTGDDDAEDDEGRAWLTIVTHDVLKDGVPYDGPRYYDGRIPVGLHADGTGEAEYVAVDGGGARSGLITGDPSSGKTALLEAIAMAKRHSGVWKVLFGDGDPEGGSSPTLNRIADWPEAGPQGVMRQLRAVEALIRVRSLLKPTLVADDDGDLRQMRPDEADTAHTIREIRPCQSFPGYVWIIDELHRLSNDETLKAAGFIGRMEQILRIGRKYGVVVLAGTQSLLGGDYGGSTPLRAYLASRNAFIMRSTNRSEQHTLNGVAVAPGTLPKGGGYAYAVGTGRLSLLRVAWSATMSEWAAGFPVCTGDPDSEMAIAKHRPQDDADAATALVERMTRLTAWRAAVRAGKDPDDADEQDEENRPAARVSVGGVAVPAPLGGKVIPMHSRPAAQPVLARAQQAKVSPRAEQVLVALRSEAKVWTSAELVEATGLSASVVSKALGELVQAGLAYRPDGVQGKHTATPRGA